MLPLLLLLLVVLVLLIILPITLIPALIIPRLITLILPLLIIFFSNRNLPWNPYLSPEDRVTNRIKWFYRKDVIRQYPIDPESKLAKQEQLKDWERVLEDQIIYEQNIPPVISDDEADPEDNLLLKRKREEMIKYDNPPSWLFKDPIGPGNVSQQTVLGNDNDPPLFDPESLSH